jgi:hypothetical protein
MINMFASMWFFYFDIIFCKNMLANAKATSAQGAVVATEGISVEVFMKSLICEGETFFYKNVECIVTSVHNHQGTMLVNLNIYDPQIIGSLHEGMETIPYSILNKFQAHLNVPKPEDERFGAVMSLRKGDRIIVDVRSAKHTKDGVLQPLSAERKPYFEAYCNFLKDNGLPAPSSYTFLNVYYVKSVQSDATAGRALVSRILGASTTPNAPVIPMNSDDETPF